MAADKLPKHYQRLNKNHPEFMKAVANLGEVVQTQGPLEPKTANLIQLAAAVALRSEGAVHSHARRALKQGASPEDVRHAVMLLTSTLGFPTASAALSWVEEVLEG